MRLRQAGPPGIEIGDDFGLRSQRFIDVVALRSELSRPAVGPRRGDPQPEVVARDRAVEDRFLDPTRGPLADNEDSPLAADGGRLPAGVGGDHRHHRPLVAVDERRRRAGDTPVAVGPEDDAGLVDDAAVVAPVDQRLQRDVRLGVAHEPAAVPLADRDPDRFAGAEGTAGQPNLGRPAGVLVALEVREVVPEDVEGPLDVGNLLGGLSVLESGEADDAHRRDGRDDDRKHEDVAQRLADCPLVDLELPSGRSPPISCFRQSVSHRSPLGGRWLDRT